MRHDTVFHGILLLATLFFAYQTATRPQAPSLENGSHHIWDLHTVQRLTLSKSKKTVQLERRSEGTQSYIWIKETLILFHEEGPTTTKTREFPGGSAAEELLQSYQHLKALRSLGPLQSDVLASYHLHKNTMSIHALDDGGTHSLLLASQRIYGGSDRYALVQNADSLGFVLSGKLVAALSNPGNLALRNMHVFAASDVLALHIQTPTKTHNILKRLNHIDQARWAFKDTPDKAEQVLTDLVHSLQKLQPVEYQARDLASLRSLAHIDFLDAHQQTMGYLNLYQAPDTSDASLRYFMKTERTHIVARVILPRELLDFLESQR